MKSRKVDLLHHLHQLREQLIEVQCELEAAERNPVPAVPELNAEEIDSDPFQVSASQLR